MTDKSYVGMGHEVCPICGTQHSTVILLHKQLRDTLPRDTCTGISLCPKHEAMRHEYVALVETSNSPPYGSLLKPSDAVLTGLHMHIRRTVLPNILNVNIPADLPFVYVDIGVIQKIARMTGQEVPNGQGHQSLHDSAQAEPHHPNHQPRQEGTRSEPEGTARNRIGSLQATASQLVNQAATTIKES